MMTLIIIIHVIACVILITLVLIQRGRGAGLVESFAGVESMFGTKTNAFLTRTTTIMSVVFFLTCLSLAVLSVRQSKSLMRNVKPEGGGLASDSQSHKPQAPLKQETSLPAAIPQAAKTEAAQTAPLSAEKAVPAAGKAE